MATLSGEDVETFTLETTNMTIPSIEGFTRGCHLFKFIASFVIVGLLAMFGLIGNSIAVAALWSDRNKSATSFLLIVLAFTDNLLLLSRFLFRSLRDFCKFTGSCSDLFMLPYERLVPVYGYPTMTFCLISSVYITLQVTVHRYIVVCWPHKSTTLGTVKVARIQAVVSFIFTIIFVIPRYTVNTVYYNQYGKVSNLSDGAKNMFALIYLLIFVSLFLYVIPLTILIILTYKLYSAVKEARMRREQMTTKVKDNEDVTVTLIVVVVVFIVCQIADPARRMVAAFSHPSRLGCGHAYFYVSEITSITTTFNSAINSVLYCICSSRFRRKVKGIFSRTHRVGSSMFSTVGMHSIAPQSTIAT